MEELWKDIIGYDGLYQVSNIGRVKGLTRSVNHSVYGKQLILGKIIKSSKQKKGYLRLHLCQNSKMTHFLTHRLVAIAFIPNPNNFKEINHKNGIKNDNRVENLEWATTSENLKHAFKIGLKNFKGENHPQSKLSEKDVIEIRYNLLNHLSNPEIAKIYNVTPSLVSRIKCMKVWKHT